MGPGMLTALLCVLIRAVPAVVGAIAEAVLCQAGALAAAALFHTDLLPGLWGSGTHYQHLASLWGPQHMLGSPHSLPQVA